MSEYFSFAKNASRPPSLPISVLLGSMLFLGIGAAVVFLFVVTPVIGQEKVVSVFGGTGNLNQFFSDLNKTQPAPLLTSPVCGNNFCETGENNTNCLQDCYACNQNGTCENNLGENQNNCLVDCPSPPEPIPINPPMPNPPSNPPISNLPIPTPPTGTPSVTCGDSVCQTTETCSNCPSDCGTCSPVCGNGVIEGTETCDTSDLNGQNCTTVPGGFTGGSLACNAACFGFDTNSCTSTPAPSCGNGLIDSGEQCDGTNLNNQSCQSQGYQTGTLSCNLNCSFNYTQCTPVPLSSNTIFADNQLASDCTSGNYSISSHTCSGTDGVAYNTIQKAANAATLAGTLVKIRGGIYNETCVGSGSCDSVLIGNSGAPSNPIVFEPYPSETVILTGMGYNDTTCQGNDSRSQSIIHITASDITIRNIEITGSTRYGINVTGANRVRIEGVNAHGNSRNNFSVSSTDDIVFEEILSAHTCSHTGLIFNNNVTNAQVNNSLFHNNGYSVSGFHSDTQGNADGANIEKINCGSYGTQAACDTVSSCNWNGSSCTVQNNSNVTSYNITFAGNVFVHNSDGHLDSASVGPFTANNNVMMGISDNKVAFKHFVPQNGTVFGNAVIGNGGRGFELRNSGPLSATQNVAVGANNKGFVITNTPGNAALTLTDNHSAYNTSWDNIDCPSGSCTQTGNTWQTGTSDPSQAPVVDTSIPSGSIASKVSTLKNRARDALTSIGVSVPW